MTTIDEKKLKIAYIGGGSMNFGWKFIAELSGEEALGGTILLYDSDKQLSLANEVIGNKLRESSANKSNFIYLAVDTPEEALRGADFVIISISQGSLDENITDLHLPEMFGIYQATIDGNGPGGVIRAIRTLPEYIGFAEKIKACCPKAWVINLSNPMDGGIRTMLKSFPQMNVFGSSNAPFATQELLAELVCREYNLPCVYRRDIKVNILGIQHFSWISEATYAGEDILPIFSRFAQGVSVSGYERRAGEFKQNPNASAQMVKLDMFLRYGAIAAQNDNYLAESCPPWYIKTPKVAQSWKFGLQNASYMKKRRLEKLARAKKLMSGEEFLRVGASGTDCVLQIKAILGLNNLITNVFLPNAGQVSCLPLGAIVQTNALFSQNSVKPVTAGALPDELTALALRQVANQETLVKAVFEKDLDVAFNAFLNDPLMTLDLASATDLYKELLAGSRVHLLYYC